MADANETERAWFLVQGTVRGGVVDKGGNEREYVVLGNNFRENLREVVMCRDCKHYNKEWEFSEEPPSCELWHYGDESRLVPSSYGFCAWGEMRADA